MTEDEIARTRWFLAHILPHEPALRAWLGRKRGAGFDSDDVIQEAYTILSSLRHHEDIRFPRAYLFRVAQSVIARQIRQSRVVSILASDDLEILDIPDDSATPEQVAIDRDELRRLADAIAAMPDRTRQAFTLRRVHGLSQREIAKRMGLSESTVEKHIARGIRFLINWAAHGGNPRLQTSKEDYGRNGGTHGQARNKSGH